MKGEILLPPNYIQNLEGNLIFLAGPIQGAPKWHNQAIKIIQNINQELHIASPSRQVDQCYLDLNNVQFKHSENQEEWEQVDWESYHLRRAAKKGVILFWFPREEKHYPGRAYAQTSRYEWGEWTTLHKATGCKIIAGIESGFPGERYIRYRASKELKNIPILSNLEDTCKISIALLK